MVQALPSNSFPTVTRPNYGEIYMKIPQNSEDHTEELQVFQQKITVIALHNISGPHYWGTIYKKSSHAQGSHIYGP
jgi:hypothetical protein